MSTIEQRITETLAAHGRDGRKSWAGLTYCTCPERWRGTNDEHHAHVAAVLTLAIFGDSTQNAIDHRRDAE